MSVIVNVYFTLPWLYQALYYILLNGDQLLSHKKFFLIKKFRFVMIFSYLVWRQVSNFLLKI